MNSISSNVSLTSKTQIDGTEAPVLGSCSSASAARPIVVAAMAPTGVVPNPTSRLRRRTEFKTLSVIAVSPVALVGRTLRPGARHSGGRVQLNTASKASVGLTRTVLPTIRTHGQTGYSTGIISTIDV